MKFIPSFLHGLLDYIFGIGLVTAPWLLGFSKNATATTFAVLFGIGTIIYSLLTNYEYGVVRIIPFRVHLIIDLLSGLFLIILPRLFQWPDRYGAPFIWFGIYALCMGALTIPRVLGLDQLLHSRY